MLWGSLLGLSLFACKAPEVKNHVEERGHEMPWSIALHFTPGTVQDTTAFYADGFTPSGQAALTYKVTTNAEEGGVAKSDPIHLKKGVWYHLNIHFYNKAGVLLNAQYLTLEQAPMHQFFFTCTRLKDAADTIEIIFFINTIRFYYLLLLYDNRNLNIHVRHAQQVPAGSIKRVVGALLTLLCCRRGNVHQ